MIQNTRGKLDVLVVGYNSLVTETKAVEAAESSDFVHHIVFCDNSTDSSILAANRNYRSKRLQYVEMHGNWGLPRAYNAGIGHCASEHVAIFDDDTEISADFFERTANWVDAGIADILVPVVLVDGEIMSPCARRWNVTFRPIRNLQSLPRKFSAINSGMVVSRSIFDNYRYDERYFLDFVDHKFVADMWGTGKKIAVMDDVFIEQDYSITSDDKQSSLTRLKIFRRDSGLYYSTPSGKIARLLRVGLRYLKLTWKKY